MSLLEQDPDTLVLFCIPEDIIPLLEERKTLQNKHQETLDFIFLRWVAIVMQYPKNSEAALERVLALVQLIQLATESLPEDLEGYKMKLRWTCFLEVLNQKVLNTSLYVKQRKMLDGTC